MALASSVAIAAEPPVYQPPPPVIQPICVPRSQAYLWPGVPICLEEEFGNWYLRGDIGMTNQSVKKLDNFLYAGNTIEAVGHDFTSSMLFGLGLGFEFNEWLRLDATGEYRGKSEFQGIDIVNGTYTDEYRAKKSEWLFLINGYVDLGTWWCITPFVGAGVGFSRVTIGSFLDVNTVNGGVAFADTASQWNVAWALHAGLAFQASPTWTAEFAYRYVSLGDGITGDIVTYNGVNQFNNPMHFKDITSHDFKLGLRWTCCEPDPLPPPPPPMIYQPPPPPLYAPPPIQKG
ncbi:MAG: outer membrane beta-barrel protein [Xanthobacteraceae bacterium]